MKLDGKIAVITSGTNGMGRAAARLFVREGAHEYLTGRGQQGLDAMATEPGSAVTPSARTPRRRAISTGSTR